MRVFKDKKYYIEIDRETIKITGCIESETYKEMEHFLRDSVKTIETDQCVFDITQVDFLNSKGIMTIVHFLLESNKVFVLNLDYSKTWQKYGLVPLLKMYPDKIQLNKELLD